MAMLLSKLQCHRLYQLVGEIVSASLVPEHSTGLDIAKGDGDDLIPCYARECKFIFCL
jgi:hypothetical protein